MDGKTVSAHLGVGVNALRRDHALDLDAVRRKREKEKAAAALVSKDEREEIALIEKALNSRWTTPKLGCVLYGGARTVAEALAWPRRSRSL